MSNRLCIEPTEFKNVRSNSTSFGFRAYDDADQTYDNTFESIPDDDLEFLRAVVMGHQDEHLAAMLEFVVENHKGVYVSDTWYEWGQIKDIVDEDNAPLHDCESCGHSEILHASDDGHCYYGTGDDNPCVCKQYVPDADK